MWKVIPVNEGALTASLRLESAPLTLPLLCGTGVEPGLYPGLFAFAGLFAFVGGDGRIRTAE